MRTSTPAKALFVIAFGLSSSLAFSQDAAKPAAGKPPEAKTHILTRAEFDALAAHPEQLVVVDVRRPDEVTSIGGFPVYLSIQLADLEKSIAWIPKDRKVVVVSNHAGRAGRAGDLLAAKGLNVAGRIGVQNYEEQGGKLTKIAPPAKKEGEKTAQAK
jgi:rhodanese-related sulfurtransferase